MDGFLYQRRLKFFLMVVDYDGQWLLYSPAALAIVASSKAIYPPPIKIISLGSTGNDKKSALVFKYSFPSTGKIGVFVLLPEQSNLHEKLLH